ncbi:MAG: ATP-binding protein [archaeon]
MEKNQLRQIIVDQQSSFSQEELIDREIDLRPYLIGNEIVIISGIRRCGKSSLLKILAKKYEKKLYINFDDIRFVGFSQDNFHHIYEIAIELFNENPTYFLDEIQNIPNWERWANNLNDKEIKVYITGSNSSLLSSEISTYLTGRNKVIRLFPFSFKEYLKLKNIPLSKTSEGKSLTFRGFQNYLETGGFPLVIKNNDMGLSKNYFEDILNKDILARYNIRQADEIKTLALYLFTNSGSIYSYSKLKEITKIKSLSTIKNYIDYFRNTYLLYTIDRFDYSVAKQKISSSKVYAGDISFLKTVSFSFSQNLGKRLENLVFLDLIRKGNVVYYYLDKKECDFVIKDGLKISQAIQVCKNSDSIREIEGLKQAMSKYKLKEGLILTFDEEKQIGNIKIMPIWKWLLGI